MLAITKERERKGLKKSELARRAEIQATTLGWIEEGRFKPYDSQLNKLAVALKWEGEPACLLSEVQP
jgi:ribosome-binding protein aMBF1 (putative translation factor)